MFDKDVSIYVEKIKKNGQETNALETAIEKHYTAFEKLVEDKKKVQQQISEQTKVMNDRVIMLRQSIADEEQKCSEYMEVKAVDLSQSTRELQHDQETV